MYKLSVSAAHSNTELQFLLFRFGLIEVEKRKTTSKTKLFRIAFCIINMVALDGSVGFIFYYSFVSIVLFMFDLFQMEWANMLLLYIFTYFVNSLCVYVLFSAIFFRF